MSWEGDIPGLREEHLQSLNGVKCSWTMEIQWIITSDSRSEYLWEVGYKELKRNKTHDWGSERCWP